MPQHNLFHEYLDKVCEQIRWKKAHSVICRELGDHLDDEQAVLIESGLTEDQAANRAVLDMGDSILIGSQLDRVYRPQPAWKIMIVTAILMILGYFVRNYIIYHTTGSYPSDILAWTCAAVIAMIIGYFLDYSILGKHPLITGAVFLITVILIHNTSRGEVSGMPYNIYYYGAYLVVLLPVIYAIILWWWPYQGYSGLIAAYLTLITMTIIVLRFSIMLQTLFYGAIGGLMLTIELLKGRFNVKRFRGIFILYSPIVMGMIWLWNNSSISNRIQTILHPELNLSRGHQALQIREILNNARWIGAGGYTIDFLPDIVKNYMLTFYIHKFGWIALAIVLLLFGTLFAFSAVLIVKQKSRLGQMVASSIWLSLAVKSFLYIMNNLGVVWGGFSILPLLSYGNAALLIDSFLIGLMLSVFRNDDVVRDPIISPKRIPRIKITIEHLP